VRLWPFQRCCPLVFLRRKRYKVDRRCSPWCFVKVLNFADFFPFNQTLKLFFCALSMQLQLLLIFTLGCVGQQLAQFVPQDLLKRSVASTGGFALNVFSSECPTGSSIHDQDYCCPNSLAYQPSNDEDGNGYCCIQGSSFTNPIGLRHSYINIILGTSCQEALEQTPYCADTTWTLWNATYQGAYYGYFCCLPGQVGMNNGDCDPAGTIPSPGLSAIMVSDSLFERKSD